MNGSSTPPPFFDPYARPRPREGEPYVLEIQTAERPAPRPRRPRWLVPLVLFVVTCASTYLVGDLLYAAGVMFILTAHELGHYVQARRYRVPASLPYFIPMPLTPVGTMGALILMRHRITNTRALFDIGITGPLAGLGPALLLSAVGLMQSEVTPLPEGTTLILGEPLVFKLMSSLIFGPLPEGQDVLLHPLAFAGWVGIFITALNLIPIGQLDGGHILYALLRRKAHPVATAILALGIVGMVVGGYWGWSLIIVLLILIGPKHPPTDDDIPLDRGRQILGWLTLAFMVVGFTPTPFIL